MLCARVVRVCFTYCVHARTDADRPAHRKAPLFINHSTDNTPAYTPQSNPIPSNDMQHHTYIHTYIHTHTTHSRRTSVCPYGPTRDAKGLQLVQQQLPKTEEEAVQVGAVAARAEGGGDHGFGHALIRYDMMMRYEERKEERKCGLLESESESERESFTP